MNKILLFGTCYQVGGGMYDYLNSERRVSISPIKEGNSLWDPEKYPRDTSWCYMDDEGNLHREDGPAVGSSHSPLNKRYFLHGHEVSKESFDKWKKQVDWVKAGNKGLYIEAETSLPAKRKTDKEYMEDLVKEIPESIFENANRELADAKKLAEKNAALSTTKHLLLPDDKKISFPLYTEKYSGSIVKEDIKRELKEELGKELLQNKEELQKELEKRFLDFDRQIERKLIPQTDIISYTDEANFVGALINIGAVESNDFIKQVSKCEGWTQEERTAIRECANSFIRGDLNSSLTQLKTLISQANNKSKLTGISFIRTPGELVISTKEGIRYKFTKNMDVTEKAEYLDSICKNIDYIKYIRDFNCPELTKEEVNYWYDKKMFYPSSIKKTMKEDKTKLELEKIDRLVSENKVSIDDLDKYVALGIISSAGLKAWRVKDQVNNNFFYSDYEQSLINHDEMYGDLIDFGDDFLDEILEKKQTKFESEVSRAAYRVAATQLNNITRAIIIKALPEYKSESMKSFLASEIGNSLVSMVGGITLTYAMENNNKAQKLAKELRVSGMATLGNEAVDGLIDMISEVIKNAVDVIPAVEEVTSSSGVQDDEEIEFLLMSAEEKKEMLG